MYKSFIVSVFLFIVICGGAYAGVVGSKHDLRRNTSFSNHQEVCNVCHVPHRSSGAFLGPKERVYKGGSVTIYGGTLSQPSNSSAACLSCHDGLLAPSVGANSSDFTSSHPFSVAYPIKSDYNSPSGGKITNAYGTVVLEGASKNMVECGSCHNPHEEGISSKFLVIEKENSNLCLTCHQK